MHRVRRSIVRGFPLHQSVFVLAVTAIALLLAQLLRPLFYPDEWFVFLFAIFLSSWFYGWWAGVSATIAAGLAFDYFFIEPAFSFLPHDVNSVVRLLCFGVAGTALSLLAGGLRGTRGLLAETLSSIGDAVIATDTAGRVNYMNAVAETLTGWSAPDAQGKPVTAVFRAVHPKTGEALAAAAAESLARMAPPGPAVSALLSPKPGVELAIEFSAAPIRRQGGEIRGGLLVFRDITARRQLEEQLAHSQKMDAVGRLAGGVAGDFNNLLTVITGYGELIHDELPADTPLRRYAEEIVFASKRAASLARQLLAFSNAEAVEPRLIDINSVLQSMEPMLRHIAGEPIELILLPGAGIGRIKCDPAQFEQIVMNLTTNAREALPCGGKLVIETADADLQEATAAQLIGVPPGAYVMLAVSDTGIGMDADTRSRLFEPFFTTKPQSKGSGLGLSMVYGTVKQAGGQVTVYSQPGCGSIFEVYFPRQQDAGPAAGPTPKPSGSETILLVDDEEGVRKLVNAILRSSGYSVIEAISGSAALAAYEKNEHRIDLVLTDLAMPQMSGLELGSRLGEKNPALKILYMSGSRETAMDSPEPNRDVLYKPFTPDDLLHKLRERLDAPAA